MQCLYDTGDDYKVQPTDDGAVNDIGVGGDCVCGGIGDEFAISYSASSLQVSFQPGSKAVIGGAYVDCNENETITLQPNSTISLVIRIDKTQPNGQRSFIHQTTSSGIQKQNLNGSGNIRDLLLYTVTTNTSGIVSVQDMRVIRNSGSTQIGGKTIWDGTEEEYEALTTKDNNTVYLTYDEA